MKQGVNKNGVEYTRLKDKTYLCRLYLGEGVQLEKVLNVTSEEKSRNPFSPLDYSADFNSGQKQNR
jgi:hypothetical protein